MPELNPDGVSVKGCSIIYAPAGQAGEYSALAANPYRGCGHKCAYCYVPNVLRMSRTEFDEGTGSFSPDSRWIAYQSDESGRYQVYVQSFPVGSGKWQISAEGGSRALWSRDGKQIFYISPDWKLMAVDVAAHGDTFEAGVPRVLFQTSMVQAPGRNYDVSADGKRFLVDSTVEQQEIAPITLVQNWTAALGK